MSAKELADRMRAAIDAEAAARAAYAIAELEYRTARARKDVVFGQPATCLGVIPAFIGASAAQKAVADELVKCIFSEVFAPKMQEVKPEVNELGLRTNLSFEYVSRTDEEILACAVRALKIIQQALTEQPLA